MDAYKRARLLCQQFCASKHTRTNTRTLEQNYKKKSKHSTRSEKKMFKWHAQSTLDTLPLTFTINANTEEKKSAHVFIYPNLVVVVVAAVIVVQRLCCVVLCCCSRAHRMGNKMRDENKREVSAHTHTHKLQNAKEMSIHELHFKILVLFSVIQLAKWKRNVNIAVCESEMWTLN